MRKYLDCSEYPSEKACSLRISGTEDEVLDAAYDHAVKAHGETPSPELREQIRGSLRDEDDRAEGRIAPGAGVSQPGMIH